MKYPAYGDEVNWSNTVKKKDKGASSHAIY